MTLEQRVAKSVAAAAVAVLFCACRGNAREEPESIEEPLIPAETVCETQPTRPLWLYHTVRLLRAHSGATVRLDLHLKEGGQLLELQGSAPQQTTLAELQGRVDGLTQMLAADEDLFGENPPPGPVVVLTVDDAVPWQHAAWVFVVCCEEGVRRAILRSGESEVALGFRPNSSLMAPPVPRRLRIQVRIDCEGKRKARGCDVVQPATARVFIGEREFASVGEATADIGSSLTGAMATGDPGSHVGMLEIPPATQSGWVLSLLSVLQQAGLEHVSEDVILNHVPNAGLRNARALPYPEWAPER